LYTKRILVKRGFGNIPFWLRKLLANRKELIVEESIIDLKKKEILTRTRNFGGLARYAVMTEDCRYIPMLRRSNSTQIDRCFVLQSSLGVRVLHPLWSFLNRRYTNSAESSLQGYRFICQQFAGQLDSCPNAVSSPSKIAHRLKDFALNKRPHLLLAQAGSDNSD
uniref:PRELI/MSF1 domain-containing protein n=1 Tax=Hydatigena taeniaeformis TaxID=6205 RepID=A0A0R3WLF6_HYDTA